MTQTRKHTISSCALRFKFFHNPGALTNLLHYIYITKIQRADFRNSWKNKLETAA